MFPACCSKRFINFLRALPAALAAALLCVAGVRADAQTTAAESGIATFAAGSFPVSSLVQAADLNFYGVTEFGGSAGYGSVFRLSPAGEFATVYSFSGGADGGLPVAGVTIGADGNLYGTTLTGAANNFGGVFRLTPAGELTTLHSFDANADGNSPNAALTIGPDGTLYGTLAEGAYDATSQTYAAGTIFSISPSGQYADLYSWPADGSLGSEPAARLLQASDGNLWGATTSGGANGYGTVFRYSPGSGTMTDVYDPGAADGTIENGLTEYNGVLCGVTFPDALDSGEIFSVTLAGQFAVAYTFSGGSADGGSPATALFAGKDGALYGATQSGGANGAGTFFRYVPGAAPVSLFSFAAGTVNTMQDAALVEGADAAYYLPVLFDSTAGLAPAAMDGAGVGMRLAPDYAVAPAPPVSLTAFTQTPAPGSAYTLAWSARGQSQTEQTCFASGGWSGQKSASGTASFTAGSAAVTYALTCGGNVSSAVTVTPAAPQARVALSGPASVRQGQSGSLTVTVTGSGAEPSGTVSFVADGVYTIGTVTLSTGAATLQASTAGVPPGTYSIAAKYSGDSSYPAAVSDAISVTVTPAKTATSTSLTVTPMSIAAGGKGTLTATVSSQASATVTGSVTFYSDGYTLGSAPVSSGTATLVRSVAGVPPGTYPVYAVYSGDGQNTASTSNTVDVSVQ